MATKKKQLTDEVRCILSRATTEGQLLRLASMDDGLDRALYTQVAKAIEAMGGKWNKKQRGYTFDRDPAPLLAQLLGTSEVPHKNEHAFFETPPLIVERLYDLAEEMIPDPRQQPLRVLEPSAGLGAIALSLKHLPRVLLDCIEIDAVRAESLCTMFKGTSVAVHCADFLTYRPPYRYDLIVMNPPFATPDNKTAWIDHVWHAKAMLAPGGRLLAIVPAGFQFREDKRHTTLRTAILAHGRGSALPPDTFAASGTKVQTYLLQYDEPYHEDAEDMGAPSAGYPSREPAPPRPLLDRPCGQCDAKAGEPCRSVGGHALMAPHMKRVKQGGEDAAQRIAYQHAVVTSVFGRVDDQLLERCRKEMSIDLRKSWVKKAIAAGETDAQRTTREYIDDVEALAAPTVSPDPELKPGTLVLCECGCPRHGHYKHTNNGRYGMKSTTYGKCAMRTCRGGEGSCQQFREAKGGHTHAA